MKKQLVSIADLMQTSGVSFGTSGARGTVVAMTDRTCYAYTVAFLQMLRARNEAPVAVAIAGDLRPSTGRIMAACAQAVRDQGIRLENCGRVPSPTVALFGLATGIPAIMVTGSHIPDDRNGIKFNTAAGEITKADETGMKAQSVEIAEDLFDAKGMLAKAYELGLPNTASNELYLSRYLDFFGPHALQGLRIGLYQHSSVGRDLAQEILTLLGAEVTALGRSEKFIPVDTEAIRPEDVALAREWAAPGSFDAIVSMDGDADRPLLSDEKGEWLRGDVLGILVARSLGITRLAIPVSCNTAAEKCGSFSTVCRTRIGSPFVIEAMQMLDSSAGGPVAGYEANGGFLLQSKLGEGRTVLGALPTRDAILPIVAVLAHSKRDKRPVSALLADLPPRFTASDRLKEFPTAVSAQKVAELGTGDLYAIGTRLGSLLGEEFSQVVAADKTDGLRMTVASGEVVHLRPSGNAPELRCYAEADSASRASELVAFVLQRLETWRP